MIPTPRPQRVNRDAARMQRQRGRDLRHAPTVADLLARLAQMRGRLTRRDRELVTETMSAIDELTVRLHQATTRGDVQIQRIPEDTPHGEETAPEAP